MAKKPENRSEFRPPSTLEERGALIKNLKDDLDALTVEVGALRQGGEEVDGFVKSISLLIFELTDERGEPKRFIKDQDRFAKTINKISKKIDKIKNKLQELAAEKPEVQVVEPAVAESVVEETPNSQDIIEEQIKEDVKELEVVAAGEDMEFKKHEERYFDSEKKLEEFLGYIDSFDLEKENTKDIKDFKDSLVELKTMLNNKEYDKFKEVYELFIEALKDAYEQVTMKAGFKKLESEQKQSIPVEKEQPKKEKKVVAKAVKPVVVQTEQKTEEIHDELKQKEWEDRIELHNNLRQDFMRLAEVVRVAHSRDVSRELFEKYDNDMGGLQEFLDIVKETNDLKVFDVNINNFNKKFNGLINNLEPDLKYAFENNGVFPKKEKPIKKEVKKEQKKEIKTVVEKPVEEKKIESKLEPLDPEVEKEIVLEKIEEKPVVEIKTSEKESVAAGEIPDKGVVEDKVVKTEKKIELSSELPQEKEDEVLATKTAEEKPEEPKKGLWKRFKEAIFHPETKKVAKKVSYDTVTSILGIKLITDALYAIKGKGDIVEWWKGRKESKGSKEAIAEAYKGFAEAFEEGQKNNKENLENEKIEKHLANLKTKIEASSVSPEEKKSLLIRLLGISTNHKKNREQAIKERDGEMNRALDAYVQVKVSDMKIARDVFNFALTATGMAALRGVAYASASVLERVGKARKEFTKETLGKGGNSAERKFVAKDVIVNSAIETARALIGKGEKKGEGGVRRAVDFVKAFGMVARGFGIYGLAISGTTVHEQAIDKLLVQLKEQGTATTISKNFANHMERVWETYSNPTSMLGGNKEPEKSDIPSAPEPSPVVERQEIPVPVEVPVAIGIDQIISDNKLSAEFSDSLVSFLKQHPELSNQESIQNILNASKIGPDTHSHHESIIKGTIDTLDESGGERRQVIFEEILKHGGPKAAADYLQSQYFSSQHLSHLSGYIRKGTPDEYLKFVEKYNTKDARMVSGLFQAMQGRESTDLANAGLEVDASGSKPGIDNHVRGKVSYFGLENGKPVLSGSGSVSVDQMGAHVESVDKNVVTDKDKGLDLGQISVKESVREDWQKMGSRLAPQWEGNAGNQVIETSAVVPQVEPSKIEVVPPRTHVEKTINTYKSSELAPVVESTPVTTPVEKPLPTEKIQTPAPKQESAEIKPEKSPASPLNEFLKEYGSSKKEFFGNFENMRNEMGKHLDNSLIYTEGGEEFLREKAIYLHGLQEKYKNALENGLKLSATDLRQMDKLLRAEELYKNGKSEWMENLDKAIFSKNDLKVMELALASHTNPNSEPILTNDSSGVRVWDPEQKKDVFLHVQGSIFNLDKDGNLVEKNSAGETVTEKEKVLKIFRK